MDIRSTRLAVIAIAVVTCTISQNVFSQEIRWLRSADEAAKVSANSGKPILVYARSQNCMYCDLMQKKVWADPLTVKYIAEHFVPLKITKEDNPEAVEALQVVGFPTTVIFSPEHKFLAKFDGYITSEKLMPKLLEHSQTNVARLTDEPIVR